MSLRRKIRELENSCLEPFQRGTSKIDITELSEAEQTLFRNAYDIYERYGRPGNNYEFSEYERKILDKAMERLYVRSIDIFSTMFHTLLCQDDNIYKTIFDLRLLWFMAQIRVQIQQMQKEAELIEKYPKYEDFNNSEEVKQLYVNWEKPFSEESFHNFLEKIMLKPKMTQNVTFSKEVEQNGE